MSTALLESLAVEKPKAKKSSTPVIFRPELEPLTTKRSDVKQGIKDLEAELASIDHELTQVAEPERCRLSRAQGEYLGSIKLNSLTLVTYANSQKAYDSGELSVIQPIMGSYFGKYFQKQYSINVDVASLPDVLIQALRACGAEINVVTKATKELHHDATMNPDVNTACQKAGVRPVSFFR